MPKKIWDMNVGRPVESSPGSKTIGDYSGLHKPGNTIAQPVLANICGTGAQQHLDVSFRRTLNEGENFSGFLVSKKVDHVTLHIGTHPIHGLSAYADRLTSHADGRIEVIVFGATRPVVLSRNEYFSQLLEAEIPEAAIDE